MDSVSARTSIEDYGSSYGSNTMIEAKVHDVMSIEMSHHQMGGSYLDPRSFGSNNSYDDYPGSSINDEHPIMGVSSNGMRHTQYQQVTAVSIGLARQDGYHHHRYENVYQHQQRPVLTYPVKTASISSCKQYVPPPRAILALKQAPRRSHSRNNQRKEQLDPKRVEDEVARNVSQILSATKQQKLQQEAQQRSGCPPTGPRLSYVCPDCGKNMTSFRNLQRHRQFSCINVKKQEGTSSNPVDQSAPSNISTIAPEDPGLPSMDSAFCSPTMPFSMNESCDWYSADSFPSAISRDRSDSADINMDSSTNSSQIPESNCGLPLLDYEDSQNLSSSASHCSSGSTGASTPAAMFTCDSCKKAVCSHRSLKRHHTTCKQYIADYGLPPESEATLATLLLIPSISQSSSTTLSDGSSPVVSSSSDYIVNARSSRLPKYGATNTCPDCNRQLCSSSNLKRHRATCKAASGMGGPMMDQMKSSPLSPSDEPMHRSRISSFASDGSVSFERSSGSLERQYSQGYSTVNGVQIRRQPPPTVYITVSDPARQTSDMNITVGEHLRAQHQKIMDNVKGDSPGAEVRGSSNQMTSTGQNRSQMYAEDITEVDNSPVQTQFVRSSVSGSSQQSESYISTYPLNASMPEQRLPPRMSSVEFQCPECKKLYSCRKNVKRHRMAVHKMSPEDISRYPGPIPCPTALNISVPELSPCSTSCRANGGCTVKQEPKSDYPMETPPVASGSGLCNQIRYHTQTLNRFDDSPSWANTDCDEMSENSEMARIGVELKRNNEYDYFDAPDEKKPKAELAEADTTFNEDLSCGNDTLSPNSPSVSSDNYFTGLPPLHSWAAESKHFRGYSRSETSSPAFGKLFQCDRCKRCMSSEYSLRRHRHNCQDSASALSSSPFFAGDSSGVLTLNTSTSPFSDGDPMLGHGPSSASRFFEEDWFKREQIPDSTTSHRVDRSSSPFSMLDQTPVLPPLGNLPYTRKRALSGGSSTNSDSKQVKHLCQACGKFYSSEWNLERHKRESCPTKGVDNSATVSDDVSVLFGVTRFVISKAALSRASSSFVQLFNTHDPSKGDFRLDVDPGQFQELLDVFNNPGVLNAGNVDSVMHLSDKLKFNSVFDFCSKFVKEDLPRSSVMHALRLADRHGLTSIRRKLIDNISIDIFRSLPADYHFKKMDAELKAELMEKWGTLL